jgi:2-polyprenyl-3-methyl-5-hydroxy-6-metoxy-1,4-benzoquinol methylase
MEKKVKEQYTQYTYPKYREYMDKLSPIPSQFTCNLFLEQINHYIYGGDKVNFNNYNILVAGVGLGDDIINMSFLLKKYENVKLLGIDLSPTALNICSERIKKYNLKNIELIEMSLLELNSEIHGNFDLIICIGVLHHLENPLNGLLCLKNVLKDDGFMNIMVYGKYGRTGIYQMQELMQKINININDYNTKINNFKNVYNQLKENNWFKLGEHLINDHKNSDEGIVDLLLHCQDRSYSVSELYKWIENCNLNIIEFSPDTRYKYKYNIKNINYPNENVEKYCINELFFGDMIKHHFYISKNINIKAKIEDLNNKLVLVLISRETLNLNLENYKKYKYRNCSNFFSSIKSKFKKINYQDSISIDEIYKKVNLNINLTLTYKLDEKYIWFYSNNNFINFNIEINDIIYIILLNIDNKKTLNQLFDIVRKELKINIDNSKILELFKPVYEKFELYDMILLEK